MIMAAHGIRSRKRLFSRAVPADRPTLAVKFVDNQYQYGGIKKLRKLSLRIENGNIPYAMGDVSLILFDGCVAERSIFICLFIISEALVLAGQHGFYSIVYRLCHSRW